MSKNKPCRAKTGRLGDWGIERAADSADLAGNGFLFPLSSSACSNNVMRLSAMIRNGTYDT